MSDYADHPLFQHIVANPDDLDARIVFADLLEENGDPRADFIRLQHQLTLPNEDDQWRRELETASRAAFRRHGGFGGDGNYGDFFLGFLDRLSVPTKEFLAHPLATLSKSPIRHLTLTRGANQMSGIAEIPELSRLHSLSLRSTLINNDPFEQLVNSPNLKRLEVLNVYPDCSGEIATLLATAPVMRRLRKLTLDGVMVKNDSLQQIASAEGQLNTLKMGRGLSDEGLTHVAESYSLRSLEHLRLVTNGHHYSERSLQRLGESNFAVPFKTLELSTDYDTPMTYFAFPRFAALETLGRRVGSHFTDAQKVQHALENLKQMRHWQLYTDGAGARAVANSPRLQQMAELWLRVDYAVPSDVQAILESQYFSLETRFQILVNPSQDTLFASLQDTIDRRYAEAQSNGNFQILTADSATVLAESQDY